MPPPRAQLPSSSDPALLAALGGGGMGPQGGPMPMDLGGLPPGGGPVALLAQIQMLLDQVIQLLSAQGTQQGPPPGM